MRIKPVIWVWNWGQLPANILGSLWMEGCGSKHTTQAKSTGPGHNYSLPASLKFSGIFCFSFWSFLKGRNGLNNFLLWNCSFSSKHSFTIPTYLISFLPILFLLSCYSPQHTDNFSGAVGLAPVSSEADLLMCCSTARLFGVGSKYSTITSPVNPVWFLDLRTNFLVWENCHKTSIIRLLWADSKKITIKCLPRKQELTTA